MHLLIKPETDYLKGLYSNHEHFHAGDSGIDLYFPDTITIDPGETKRIDLKIRCEAMRDYVSNTSYYLYPRSSIVRTPLRMSNSVGIIDAGYRGTITVFVDNIKNTSYTVERGKRLFQICSPDLSPITFSLNDMLSETSRGSGGFGSTDAPRNILNSVINGTSDIVIGDNSESTPTV